MDYKNYILLFLFVFTAGCVGYSSTGVLGTGVSVAIDPRTIGTQIDDSIMQKNLRAKLILMDKSYLLNVKTKVLDGRIFITGKVNTVEEKLKITKLGWEIKGARSVKNDLKIKEKFNFTKIIYVYGISQNEEERAEVINEAKQVLDVEDVVTSIFLVEDLRVIKN